MVIAVYLVACGPTAIKSPATDEAAPDEEVSEKTHTPPTRTVRDKIKNAKPLNQLNLLGTWVVIDTRFVMNNPKGEEDEALYDIQVENTYTFKPDSEYKFMGATANDGFAGTWVMETPTVIRLDSGVKGTEFQHAYMTGNHMYWMAEGEKGNTFLFLEKVK
jgi:hypothetical protein